MSPWWFSIFVNGCMREIIAKAENVCACLRLDGVSLSLVTFLSADNTILLPESARVPRRPMDKFYIIFLRRKLRGNVRERKTMVF